MEVGGGGFLFPTGLPCVRRVKTSHSRPHRRREARSGAGPRLMPTLKCGPSPSESRMPGFLSEGEGGGGTEVHLQARD